jgi:hypothetical protein
MLEAEEVKMMLIVFSGKERMRRGDKKNRNTSHWHPCMVLTSATSCDPGSLITIPTENKKQWPSYSTLSLSAAASNISTKAGLPYKFFPKADE